MNLLQKKPLGQKHDTTPSKAIRASAQGETCTLGLPGCDYDQTVVYAHLRFFGWAGIAQKPEEPLGVYACQNCHDAIDGRNKVNWGYDDVLCALGTTLLRLKHKGLLVCK